MELVRKGGRIMVIGNHARTIDFPLQRCITEQIDVQFSYSSAGEYPVCLQAIAEGRAGLTGLWQSFPLAEGAQVFDRPDPVSSCLHTSFFCQFSLILIYFCNIL